jgi:hypothetical protein
MQRIHAPFDEPTLAQIDKEAKKRHHSGQMVERSSGLVFEPNGAHWRLRSLRDIDCQSDLIQ